MFSSLKVHSTVRYFHVFTLTKQLGSTGTNLIPSGEGIFTRGSLVMCVRDCGSLSVRRLVLFKVLFHDNSLKLCRICKKTHQYLLTSCGLNIYRTLPVNISVCVGISASKAGPTLPGSQYFKRLFEDQDGFKVEVTVGFGVGLRSYLEL